MTTYRIVPQLILCGVLLTPAAATAKRAKQAPPVEPPADEEPPETAPANDNATPGGGVPATETSPPPAPAEPEEPSSKRLGLGYKIGNGLGFVGADVIVNVVDHLSLDLQVNHESTDVATPPPLNH